MIQSEYGPPFDNSEWEERKEEIKNFIESAWIHSSAEPYVIDMVKDLWVALEAEESDVGMLARNLAEIYDELSGGLISKPNTLPREVIGVFQNRISDSYHDGYSDGYDIGYETGKDDGIAGEDI